MRTMNKTNEKTFEFRLTLPKKVVVTDPCYSLGTWCAQELEIKEGEYICKVESFGLNDGWGKRNYIITLNHISCPKKKATIYETELGVDSGQMGIFAYDYFKENQPKEDWYRSVCDITLGDDACGLTDNQGIVTESGCGDGEYELLTGDNSKGEIVALKISFI